MVIAALDWESRVRGIESLRVVNSYIFQTIPNGNLNAPSIMVGKKGSDIILGRPSLAPSNAPVYIAPEWETKRR